MEDKRMIKGIIVSVMSVAAGLALLVAPSRAFAQSDECLVEAHAQGGATIDEGDTLCAEAVNKRCTFQLQLCVNGSETGCAAGDIKGKKVKAKGHCGPVGRLFVSTNGSSSACGSFTGVTVRTKKNGKREGRCNISVATKTKDKPARKDKDKFILVCKANAGECPATTTSTTTTTIVTGSTTTTTLAACDCCATGTRLSFTTSAPSATVTGHVLSPTGTNSLDLTSGGLYIGGSGVGIPLPNQVPDMGNSLTKIQSCNGSTGTFQIASLSDVDTGSNRNCTAAGVTNPEYPGKDGCLFGPPLPIPNPGTPSTSTCVVNRVVTNASGNGDCNGNLPQLNLPLGSDIYLTGDVLPGTSGVQPCPLCVGNLCQGGPNDGVACTPGSSALGDPFPTSHDCPPPVGVFVGTLPIPFELSTGSKTKTAVDMADGVGTDRLFCGFCASQFGVTFQNPAVACTNNSQCTNASFPSCKQRNSGAFGVGNARTITETGTSANACLADGLAHNATLVSVFCIPPAFNATVDSVGDLPSPGAVSLPGQSQILP
jgi:hypothetical protein